MAQYCDSQQLERNWFHWLLSSKVPELEKYRSLGLLWTKVIGIVLDDNGNPIRRHGKTLQNPSHPIRTHCIALSTPIFFNSHDGVVRQVGLCQLGEKRFRHSLPTDDVLNLLSDSQLHCFDEPLRQQTVVVPDLISRGFFREAPTSITWHAILEDINRMCHGIGTKFKPRSEEEHQELTNEAVLQVINKLATYKLVYTPGRAPVFNLLTTTIYRIMYSIMNRRKQQRESIGKLINDAEAGVLPRTNRSLRVETNHRRPIKAH